jgi:hypothetical protein
MILPGFFGLRDLFPRHGQAGDESRKCLYLLSDQLIEPRHRLGGLGVADHGRPLVLPKIQIAAGQLLKLFGVVFHKPTIEGVPARWLWPNGGAEALERTEIFGAKCPNRA